VPSYLVETYLAKHAHRERIAREGRARSAAEELSRRGTLVKFEGAIHVPEDEMCFFIFDAPSSEAVTLAAERGRLHPLRVLRTEASTASHDR